MHGEVVHSFMDPSHSDANVYCLAWSPDHSTLAVGGASLAIELWDLSLLRVRAVLSGQHDTPVTSVQWLDGGERLVSGSGTEVCYWNAETGELSHREQLSVDRWGPPRAPPYAWDRYSPYFKCVHPDRISSNGGLRVSCDVSVVRVRDLDGPNTPRSLVFLEDGQFLTMASNGDYRGSPNIEKEIVFLVQTDEGQETLTAAEFSDRYGWTNGGG